MAAIQVNNWTIFYSWQSDLPFETNQGAIRVELRNVISELETATLRVVLDEATRETSGSPDISATIFEKICLSDIFVCDLTTINQSAPPENRRTPNPNVLIELGYAVAILGWERIILCSIKLMENFLTIYLLMLAEEDSPNLRLKMAPIKAVKEI